MKNYELTYLISPDLSEQEAETLQEKIISFVKEEGGILKRSGAPFKKKLAYPINKKFQAYLAILGFQLNPEGLAGFERKIKSENQILRYLLLAQKEAKIKPERVRTLLIRRKPKEAIYETPGLGPSEKKVELKEIEEKLEEILGK